MSNVRMLLLSILTLVCTINIPAQNISILVYVHDHYTHAPLDSALVKIIRDGIVIDSSYTAADGRTELTITPTEVEERQLGVPNTFSISENYPNPFRDETSVEFSIPESQTIRADVYNVLGQHLLSDEFVLSAGNYTLKLPFSNLPTGIYFLRVRGMEQQVVKLMKVGGDVHYEGKLARGSMQVTPRSGTSLPLKKITGQDVGYTIQVEKERYETWSVMRQIDSDTEITVPLVMLAKYLLTDIDGNVYETVKIGDQWWMAENLRVRRYRNGDAIPTNLSYDEWQMTSTGAFAIYPHTDVHGINSNEEMVDNYGKLYNWYAIDDDRGLCPEHWHIPSDDDWKQLEMYLGMPTFEADKTDWRGTDEGGKLKSTRTEPEIHPRWMSPNKGATNEYGFSGLPGGLRNDDGRFASIGGLSYWWSSIEHSDIGALARGLSYADSSIFRHINNKKVGFSVRCIASMDTSYGISGIVKYLDKGLAGVTITVSGDYSDTIQTDSNGIYSITEIQPGLNISITPSLTGYTFTPSNRTISSISSNQTGQNFTAYIEGETGTLIDIDGNIYQTVKIGNQWWMAENLRVTRYRNSDTITTNLNNTQWGNTTSGAYAIYPHDYVDGINSDEGMVAAYGKLYNWYAVNDSRGICPEGWQVPSDDDWKQLEMYLGMSQQEADNTGWRGTDEGGSLKSIRTTPELHPRWDSPNAGAANESGWSGLPGGFRNNSGEYVYLGSFGYWWLSKREASGAAWSRYLYYDYSNVFRISSFVLVDGRSVRCFIPTETMIYSISGTVTKDDTGLSGITIVVSGDYSDTTQTDLLGFYSIFGIPTGSNISITPSHPRYSFSPLNRTISEISSDQTNQDFEATTETETVTDIDGNVYQIVQIGKQFWMVENLRTTRYRNGNAIPTNLSDSQWQNTNTGAYAIYPHDDVDGINSNEEIVNNYGKLYNWYAIDDNRGLCPEYWHIPSDDDWKQLEMYLGMSQQEADNTGWRGTDAGGSLKSVRTSPELQPRWDSPNAGATNESGWTGLPGGYRGNNGGFGSMGYGGYWWSLNEYGTSNAWTRELDYNNSSVYRDSRSKLSGYSVRCLRPTFDISGNILNNGSGLEGVTIKVSGEYNQIVESDVNGVFTITGVPHGASIIIVPSFDGYDFSPSSYSIYGISGNITDRNFYTVIMGTVTDIDGNIYQTVKIGDQWWMAENLRVTRYRNGGDIPTGLIDSEWRFTTSGAYAIYPHSLVDGIHSNQEMITAYGKLYNWYAVNDARGLCPTGWHVPTDDEWKKLELYLGMLPEEVDAFGSRGSDTGGKLKSIRTAPDPHPRWDNRNQGATNESGWSGLPAGRLLHTGNYGALGYRGNWWSSTESNVYNALQRSLSSPYDWDASDIGRHSIGKRDGISVRCIKND